MVDFFLRGFTYFIFIFIDSYIYLRIFLREKFFYKPIIELSNFRKYFVTINNEDHSVWEIGNKDAVKEKTLILIRGIPTDPLKSMSWLADCLNTIDTFGSITDDIDNDFVKSNKNLKYTNGSGKGFVQLTVHSSHIDTKFVYVSTIKSKDYKVIDNNSFTINHNKPL